MFQVPKVFLQLFLEYALKKHLKFEIKNEDNFQYFKHFLMQFRLKKCKKKS